MGREYKCQKCTACGGIDFLIIRQSGGEWPDGGRMPEGITVLCADPDCNTAIGLGSANPVGFMWSNLTDTAEPIKPEPPSPDARRRLRLVPPLASEG